MDYNTTLVKQDEIQAKLAVDLAKIQAEKAAKATEIEVRGREAILKAEADLIKTRAEHVDSELMIFSERKALERIRSDAQLKMVGVGGVVFLVLACVAMCR